MARTRPVVVDIKDANTTITSPYDEELIEIIRMIPGRVWVKEEKVWSFPTSFLEAARLLLSSWHGSPVMYVDNRTTATHGHGPSTSSTGRTWAEDMFRQLPDPLRKKVFLALARVLHPDAGGDTRSAQQLNAAWDKYKS